jgi:hypothetical protein
MSDSATASHAPPGEAIERPAWRPLVADVLSAPEIEALIDRRVAYVHIPNFLAPAWCEEVVRRFSAAIAALPDHQAQRMGPALFDTLARPVEMFVDSADPEEYFSHVAEDSARIRQLYAGGDDPLEKMRGLWCAAGWREVAAAENETRPYHPDAIWGLRQAAAPPHVDAYEHDRSISLSRYDRRFNYNVYIQNAESGGHFVIYNQTGADNKPRALEGADAAALIESSEQIVHRPRPGDLVIFDAMYYHEVTQVHGTQTPRIQVHSNMLVDPAAREFLFFV